MMPRYPLEAIGCDKVSEAKHWRASFNLPPDPEDDAAYAECAWIPAGCGYRCEDCDKFVYEAIKVKVIQDYYRAVQEYEKATLNIGGGI